MSRSPVFLSARSSKTFLQILSTSVLPASEHSVKMDELDATVIASFLMSRAENRDEEEHEVAEMAAMARDACARQGNDVVTACSVPRATEEVGLGRGRRHR